MSDEIVVVGAGVIGLTTAVVLTEAGRSVRVLTADPIAETTSAVASAMCGPVIDRPGDPAADWEVATTKELVALAAGDPGSGVHIETGVLATRWTGSPPPMRDTGLEVREATGADLPDGFASGVVATLPSTCRDISTTSQPASPLPAAPSSGSGWPPSRNSPATTS